MVCHNLLTGPELARSSGERNVLETISIVKGISQYSASYAPVESSIECSEVRRCLHSLGLSTMEISILSTIVKNAREARPGELSKWRVLAKFLVQAKAMDLVARLSFLEGVADLPPGRWVTRGYAAKREVISRLGPAAEEYLKKRDSGLYRYLVVNANRFMSGDQLFSGEDLIQNEIAGLTPKGKQKKPLMWRLGKTITPEQFVKRKLTPKTTGKMVLLWLRRVAINYKTKGRPDKKNVSDSQSRIDEGIRSFKDLGERSQKSMITKVMLDRKNPAFKSIHVAIDKIVATQVEKGYLDIYKVLVANVKAGKTIKDKDLAIELGVNTTKISKAKRRIGTVVLEACIKNPKILEPAMKLEDLSQLSTSKFSKVKWKKLDHAV